MKIRYRQQDRARFWKGLERYRKALHNAAIDKAEFIGASLAIHGLSGLVPRSYRKFVNQAFNEAGKE